MQSETERATGAAEEVCTSSRLVKQSTPEKEVPASWDELLGDLDVASLDTDPRIPGFCVLLGKGADPAVGVVADLRGRREKCCKQERMAVSICMPLHLHLCESIYNSELGGDTAESPAPIVRQDSGTPLRECEVFEGTWIE